MFGGVVVVFFKIRIVPDYEEKKISEFTVANLTLLQRVFKTCTDSA